MAELLSNGATRNFILDEINSQCIDMPTLLKDDFYYHFAIAKQFEEKDKLIKLLIEQNKKQAQLIVDLRKYINTSNGILLINDILREIISENTFNISIKQVNYQYYYIIINGGIFDLTFTYTENCILILITSKIIIEPNPDAFLPGDTLEELFIDKIDERMHVLKEKLILLINCSLLSVTPL